MSKMREMKDSGIEWIGDIPTHWSIIKFKYVFDIIGGNGFPDNLQGHCDGDFPFCKVSDINGDCIYIDTANNYVSLAVVKEQKFNVIPQNSILIAKIGAALQKNHRKINKVECCIDNNTQALVPRRQDCIKYLYYITKCIDMGWFDNKGTIPSINNTKLLNFYIPNLELSEQKAIADFLDKQCAEIDAVIEKTKATIEEYKKLKQSVITEAVTKGIRSDRPMKDSGIEWIGDIPAGWQVIPHKYVMHKEKSICEHYNGEDIISLTMNGVIVRDLTAGGKMPTTFDGYQYVEPEDLLLCLFDIDVTPRCVGIVRNHGVTSPAYSRFKVHEGYYNAYYDYLLRFIDDEKVFIHLSKNLRSSLTETDFGAIKTIVPPLEEQKKIAEYLDKKCAEMDTLISRKTALLAEMETYKKSVIYEYVTGKKEVI